MFCVPLESLGLGGNRISDIGAQYLASGLTSNSRLQSLGLSDNCIGDEGASSLADLLRQTGSLQRLLLSGNEVADEGGSKLIAALTQNTSLKALYLSRNPLGDEVGQRCLEVIGRHNNTLETLDIHNTGMTTPIINNLVESMRNGGVLRVLGSRALPVGVVSEIEPRLPPSGNVLEMENWRPPQYDPILRTTRKGFAGGHSNRQTTAEALGSLPPPTETAQSLVVKAGQEATMERRRGRRRSSVSNFFRRKLSLSRGGSATRRSSHVVAGEARGGRRVSWQPTSTERGREVESQEVWREVEGKRGVGLGWETGTEGGQSSGRRRAYITPPIELQPLIEDPLDDVDSNILTSHAVEIGESDFSTAAGMEHVPETSLELGRDEEHDHHGSIQLGQSTESDVESGLQEVVVVRRRRSGLDHGHAGMGMGEVEEGGGGEGGGGGGGDDIDQSHRDSVLDSIQRRSMLHHLTTDRPKPPPQRRPPSRDRTPSPSPAHTSHGTTGPIKEEEEREEFHYNAANRMIASATPIHTTEERGRLASIDAKPLKEQWVVALRKRVGILNMGGFLHSGFQSVSSATPTSDHNYTIARLPRNSSKCRPRAPLPPAHSRVKLQLVFEEVGSDFINASYLGRPAYPREFIATQLPLDNTVEDFWRMLWEQRVGVVMVLGEVSDDVRVWPGKGEEQRHALVVNSCWEQAVLTVTGIEEFPGTIPSLTVHQFSLSSGVDMETDYLTLYHFAGWPEGGVVQSPRDVASLVHLLLATREQQTVAAPLCVMSTNGGGRTGCVCALACAYKMMTDPSPEPDCWEQEHNILDQVIRGLRRGRGGLVATQRQYEFLHQVLEQMLWGGGEGEGERERGMAEEIDGRTKLSKKKKKHKKPKGNKREQKREKTKKGRSKKKVSVGRRQGDRGHLLEEEEEGEGPTWTDQLHSQMMY